MAEPSRITVAPNSETAIRIIERSGLVIVILAIFGVSALTLGSRFFNSANLSSVAGNAAILGIIGVGITIVLTLWDFDLSVGAVATLAGIVCSRMSLDLPLLFMVALGVGVIAGLVNGGIVAYAGVSPFIGTLGTGAMFTGIYTSLLSNGYVVLTSTSPIYGLALRSYFGVPFPVWLLAALLLVVVSLLRQTYLGRSLKMVGADRRVAELRGIPVKLCRFLAFVVTGAFSGIFGFVLLSFLGTAQSGQGEGYLITAYAAAMIGIAHGSARTVKVSGTLLGALLITLLSDSMSVAALNPALIQLGESAVLILGLVVAGFTRARAPRLSS